MSAEPAFKPKIMNAGGGTQSLGRGLAVLDAVADGCATLGAIAAAVGCTRSTTQRLASALARDGWLTQHVGGYRLGTRLLRLGQVARLQSPLAVVARPLIEQLAADTADTVHLGIRDGTFVVYADKIEGRRGLEMRSRLGQRMPIAFTGLGRALMLDMDPAEWRTLFDATAAARGGDVPSSWNRWQEAMRYFAAGGVAFDREDNEIGIRCVAVPIRDESGGIVASVSVASATVFLPEERLAPLALQVQATADAISAGLGWRGGRFNGHGPTGLVGADHDRAVRPPVRRQPAPSRRPGSDDGATLRGRTEP
ncbi:IclR family transcriptional regulator [Rhizosaccharibacter radicis]|uniref:IclR family transcriptional regulator n=1 Tax=Rhizosaccharibacter radicis TaxID=2782605 RepID=A0ABT1W4K3_9PROT|nr:IclR family transcriptional regulator [Acetobacteraceae bacterium KSS12]